MATALALVVLRRPRRELLWLAPLLLLVLLPRLPAAQRGPRHRGAGAAEYLRDRGVDRASRGPHEAARR